MGMSTAYWQSEEHRQSYRTKRSEAGAYPSEAYFIAQALQDGDRVLDVGCACGGFFPILRECYEGIAYTGMDISEPAIADATARYPDGRFYAGDASDHIPEADRAFDYVQCFNVQVHVPNWRQLFAECFRVADRDLLFDLRIVQEPGEHVSVAQMKTGMAPYIFLGADQLEELVAPIRHELGGVHAYGYYHPPQPGAVFPPSVPSEQVCMMILRLSRGPLSPRTQWDVPAEFHDALSRAFG